MKQKVKKTKKNLTHKLRKNPYIVTTFALALFVIIIIIGNIIEIEKNDKNENEILCSVISTTPAWAIDGKLVQYGLLIPQNISIDLVNQEFIPQRIKMLYYQGDTNSQKQIDYFIEQRTWETYQNSGLAVNCGKF